MTKGGATVGAVGADCPHWQEPVGGKTMFLPPQNLAEPDGEKRAEALCMRVTVG